MSRRTHHRTRRQRRREDVEQLLYAYDSSGLSQAEFAGANRISLSTLRYWLRRRREEGSDADRKPALIPVTVRPVISGIAGRIEIALANGRELRLPIDTDTARVASLVAALDS